MPFAIVRNDITNMAVDAIVNTASSQPVIGWGVDAGIHQKAGPELLEARKRIGRIAVGSAAVTAGYSLPARYVIHTVAPVWRGGFLGETRLLRKCYDSSLRLALEQGCESIAFPLISAGNLGFPKEKALQTAISAISEFLLEHEMQVYLVVFSRDAFQLSEKLFHSVESFIDENYVQQADFRQYGLDNRQDTLLAREKAVRAYQSRRMEALLEHEACAAPAPRPCAAAAPAPSLNRLLEETDAGFTETLLRLIDKTGKKDSEIYKKANLSKQHFSKIRNNPNYNPTKSTAIALALALELDLEGTKDLIGRAGFALTKSSKFDVIIMYFIDRRVYDLYEINAVLFEFDQSLLGV